jgi:hypothetical protein
VYGKACIDVKYSEVPVVVRSYVAVYSIIFIILLESNLFPRWQLKTGNRKKSFVISTPQPSYPYPLQQLSPGGQRKYLLVQKNFN